MIVLNGQMQQVHSLCVCSDEDTCALTHLGLLYLYNVEELFQA